MAYNDVQKVFTNRRFSTNTNPANVTFWIAPLGSFANIKAITPAEMAASAKNVTDVVRIDGFDFGVQQSDTSPDHSFGDDGAGLYRGFDTFGGSVPFYEPKVTDLTSMARQVKTIVSPKDASFYWIERIADGKTSSDAFAAGDYYSAFKVLTGSKQYDTTDRTNGIIYTRGLLPQGDIAVNAIAATGAAPTYAPTTLTLATGVAGAIVATLLTRNITRGGTWVSSDPTKVTVSPNGVAVRVAAGTATITNIHPAATGAGTGVVVS